MNTYQYSRLLKADTLIQVQKLGTSPEMLLCVEIEITTLFDKLKPVRKSSDQVSLKSRLAFWDASEQKPLMISLGHRS